LTLGVPRSHPAALVKHLQDWTEQGSVHNRSDDSCCKTFDASFIGSAHMAIVQIFLTKCLTKSLKQKSRISPAFPTA
jgi:hypothetical protein